jgi:hypothetical protein
MRRTVRSFAIGAVVLGLSVAGLATAGAQTTTTAARSFAGVTVNESGIGKPPPGSGLGTEAALKNPKCNADSVKGWGTFDFVTEGAGPFCVAPAPKDNGGATSQGVTATTVKVVVVEPNAEQYAKGSSKPLNRATGMMNGTFKDAWIDEWAPYQAYFERWGREVEFVYVTSSGDDEAAQRADAVTIAAEKPFAVVDITPNSLPTLGTAVAASKILVYAIAGVVAKDTIAQAPYRWGTTDAQASANLAAEWAGKQLTKGKAQWAGDPTTQAKPRTFGAVYSNLLDIDPFVATFKKYGGTLATPAFEYQGGSGILGDAATAQQQAPTIIARLKDAGVTSVFLLSDAAMNKQLTLQATVQDFHPEWLLTAFQFADLGLLARNNDQEQWGHAFGLSGLGPFVKSATAAPVTDWYWGPNKGTSVSYTLNGARWLAYGLQYAGPKLSPKTFQQGFFATPARFPSAYGKTAGQPYDEYFTLGTAASAVWYDPVTVGSSQARESIAAGVTWYVNNSDGYSAGEFPKKTFNFFDKTNAVFVLDTPHIPQGPPAPCDQCPSQGGTSPAPSHVT